MRQPTRHRNPRSHDRSSGQRPAKSSVPETSPRQGRPAPSRLMRRPVGKLVTWVALGLVVIISVAILARDLLGRVAPPASSGSTQSITSDSAGGALATQTVQSGNLRVTLQLDEPVPGPRVIDVLINDTTGKPVEVSAVNLRFSMTEMDMGTIEAAAQPVSSGHFRAQGQFFSMTGRWAVAATLLRDGQAPITVPFDLAIGARGTVQPQPVPTTPEPLPPLIFARRGNIWRSDGDGAAPKQLTHFDPGTQAKYPELSSDGRRVAFTTFTPALSTSPWTLYVVNVDGSALQPIGQPTPEHLGQVAWAPDGKALFLGINTTPPPNVAPGPAQLAIVRVDLATGARQTILNNALDPVISPDGTLLAYIWLSDDSSQMALKVATLDGSGQRQVLDGAPFPDFFTPRFSPDGKRIVFAAVGGPPTDAQGNPITAGRPGPLERLLGLFEPATVRADEGIWELWIVNIDGTGLRRLTAFAEGEPVASFSPDGKQLAVLARGGIYLMDNDGGHLRRIDTSGSTGGLVWLRP